MKAWLPLLTAALLLGCPAGELLPDVDPGELDFGAVPRGTRGRAELLLSNAHDVDFELEVSVLGGPFSVPVVGTLPLAANSSTVLAVQASPTSLGVGEGVLRLRWLDGRIDVPLRVQGVASSPDDLDRDGWPAAEDCDDTDATVFPGAAEACDGVDDDCNGLVDDAGDRDQDGSVACDDCDEGDPAVFPDAPELCNGLDDDCDGAVDEGFDGDGDGVLPCSATPDCDDGNPSVRPGATEVCNGLDDDCDGAADEDFDDIDGDGFAPCVDCDDGDPSVRPGALETCNGLDDDCDGRLDEGFDGDGDGVRVCGADGAPGTADDDCDDGDPTAWPSAAEACDGVDNDCNGGVDDPPDGDGDGQNACDGDCDDDEPAANSLELEVCDGLDNDCDGSVDDLGDGDGDGVPLCGADGLVANGDEDCDDGDAAVYPGAPELCDGLDNDCDGFGDDLSDPDGDGATLCEGDCDDADPDSWPGAPELCDGVDNDCDGTVDDVDDLDGDGVTICGQDGLPGTADDDCDDGDADTYPGAAELCDGVDNDCDGDRAGVLRGTQTGVPSGVATAGPGSFRGAHFLATANVVLSEIALTVGAAAPTDVQLVVFEGYDPAQRHHLEYAEPFTAPVGGAAEVALPVALPIAAGRSYIVGVWWGAGDLTYAVDPNAPTPAPSFLATTGSVLGSSASLPSSLDRLVDSNPAATWLRLRADEPDEDDGDGDGELACDGDCDDGDPSVGPHSPGTCPGG